MHDAPLSRKTSVTLANCFPFSFCDGTDDAISPASGCMTASTPSCWARRTDVSLTDPDQDRDLRGIELEGCGRTGKLNGPGTGTACSK